MSHPFSIDDIAIRRTTEGANVSYEFDRAKAAKSILSKMQLAIETFDCREQRPEIWYYENGYWHAGGEALISYFLDEVGGNLSNSENINDVLRRIRGKKRLQPVEFDITHPHLVGCKDGITIDLRTGVARKSAPTDLISMPIPVKYDPNAKCPNFLKFLEDVTATDDDRISVIDFLASLLISEPMDFFVAAPGLGSNGRSKLKDFIRAFVGSDACRSIPLKDLSSRFTAGFLTRTRVNFCNETEVNGIILEFIKRSSEKMPVEQKFKGMVNALLYLKYFFDTNTMPIISDTSYGAERRICRWDMPWRFVDDPKDSMEKLRDPDVILKITTDEELSGVLNLILERAPEVIKQKMIHHREGGLLEYALQSRSGDVFLELFLSPTTNNGDRVHTETIKTAYQKYCMVTNSSILPPKALKTLIEDRVQRYQKDNLKIGDTNRRGYECLKFNQDSFDNAITTLENARSAGYPVFSALLNMYPDLENTTNTTKHYQTTTTNTDISNLFGSFVVKYSSKKVERNKGDSGSGVGPTGNLLQKTTTFTTFTTNKLTDSGLGGSVLVVETGKGSEKVVDSSQVVKDFLSDGGQSSLERFLAEFPEARG